MALCAGRHDAQIPPQPTVPDRFVQEATAVKERYERKLLRLPAVAGVGVGASSRDPGKAAIVVYVSRKLTRKERRAFPNKLEGVPVEIYESGVIKPRSKDSASRR